MNMNRFRTGTELDETKMNACSWRRAGEFIFYNCTAVGTRVQSIMGNGKDDVCRKS